jgi:peptidoglycan hydrolase-like protein with peptidoglycan-binding domain
MYLQRLVLGKNYPFDEIKNGKITETNNIVVKDKGEIAKIQSKLNERYGLKIAVDNIYGNETKKALIKSLQTELNKQYNAGLKVDGIFGVMTKNKIVKLKQGDKGNITYILQSILYCLGFDCKGLDGIFGVNTLKSVKNFQKSEKINIDGIVGSTTWGRLFK